MTLAGELATLIRALADSPTTTKGSVVIQGYSIAELAKLLGWGCDHVNSRLCDLGGRIAHEKYRIDGKSVTKYRLKSGV